MKVWVPAHLVVQLLTLLTLWCVVVFAVEDYTLLAPWQRVAYWVLLLGMLGWVVTLTVWLICRDPRKRGAR